MHEFPVSEDAPAIGVPLREVQMPPNLRSHGSTHELRVPIMGYNDDFGGFSFGENRDIGCYIFEHVLV